MSEDLRFPVGRFEAPLAIDASVRAGLVHEIADAPERLRRAVERLAPDQLDTPYRAEGWTVRQVAHHLPDSHVNAYIRFRLALTEDEPAVKVYDEALWAELPDARTGAVELSLALFAALHRRLAALLAAIDEPLWRRPYRHPELGLVSLERALALYAWHGRHHVAHITRLRERNGWS